MLNLLKRIFYVIVGMLLLGIYAEGYVLQGPHILELMTNSLGKGKRLFVRQKVIFLKENPEDRKIEFEETLRYNFNSQFRSDILYETGVSTYIESNDAVLKALDGKTISSTKTAYDCYKDLLLYRSRKNLQDKLTALGVDVLISSLGRFQGRVAYVVGAQYPDESISQVWFDKQSFRPIRWLIFEESGNKLDIPLEVRYLDWRQVDKIWYPMHIEFYKNNSLIREIYVADTEVDPNFDDMVFDIEQFVPPSDSVMQGEPENVRPDGLGDVQKTIDEFKKVYTN